LLTSAAPLIESPLALTPYGAGYVAGLFVLPLLGVVLIVVGIRRRRSYPGPTSAPGYPGPAEPVSLDQPAAGPAPDAAAWSPPPQGWAAPHGAPEGWAPPPAPAQGWSSAPPILAPQPKAKRPGTALIAVGAALLLFFVAGTLGRGLSTGVTGGPKVQRQLVRPDSVLGMPRNEELTTQVRQQFQSSLPSNVETSDIAVYGTPPQVFIVIAALGDFSNTGSQVSSFKAGAEKSAGVPLGDGTAVDPGPLGGDARCWSATLQAVPIGLCVFVDRGSLLSTFDLVNADVNAASERGRQVRSASVRQ